MLEQHEPLTGRGHHGIGGLPVGVAPRCFPARVQRVSSTYRRFGGRCFDVDDRAEVHFQLERQPQARLRRRVVARHEGIHMAQSSAAPDAVVLNLRLEHVGS